MREWIRERENFGERERERERERECLLSWGGWEVRSEKELKNEWESVFIYIYIYIVRGEGREKGDDARSVGGRYR